MIVEVRGCRPLAFLADLAALRRINSQSQMRDAGHGEGVAPSMTMAWPTIGAVAATTRTSCD
jgi:hypothetical protein